MYKWQQLSRKLLYYSILLHSVDLHFYIFRLRAALVVFTLFLYCKYTLHVEGANRDKTANFRQNEYLVASPLVSSRHQDVLTDVSRNVTSASASASASTLHVWPSSTVQVLYCVPGSRNRIVKPTMNDRCPEDGELGRNI
jgi:hypothetical protein